MSLMNLCKENYTNSNITTTSTITKSGCSLLLYYIKIILNEDRNKFGEKFTHLSHP